MLGTGLRISEVMGLSLHDITEGMRRGHLNIIGKGDKRRQVALPTATHASLMAYRAVRPPTELATFFVTQRRIPKGQTCPIRPLAAREVQRGSQHYAAQAALPVHLKPHKMRHTFASIIGS